MSTEKCTPGLMTARLRFQNQDGVSVCAQQGHEKIADCDLLVNHEESQANARRLAASWNACRDIPIEVLESRRFRLVPADGELDYPSSPIN
jgi:hypothetical protein